MTPLHNPDWEVLGEEGGTDFVVLDERDGRYAPYALVTALDRERAVELAQEASDGFLDPGSPTLNVYQA